MSSEHPEGANDPSSSGSTAEPRESEPTSFRANSESEQPARDVRMESALYAMMKEVARISEPAAGSSAYLPVGSSLAGGRFQVLSLVGEGGMGRVYEAFDAERRERVALKVLSRLTVEGVYRLKNEFRSLGRLAHPNLVRLYELFADEGRWFYTMELVCGERFDRYLRPSGALALARLYPALSQLVAGVHAIHAAGKLHRDLKPNNVLVDDTGRVVVLDFGLMVDAYAGGVGQTRSEHGICGTPAYMAPEQAAGKAATSASDLYAIGVMLFEALTGQPPFAGSAGELLAAKQRDVAVSPRSLALDVPSELAAACQGLLARDAALRPSAGALLTMLGAHEGEFVEAARHPPTLLFGRDAELLALRSAFHDVVAGKPVVVCVTGESGIGKSALCETALRELAAVHGATLLAGRCHERESVPFKAFDGLIDATCRSLRRAELAQVAELVPREAGALKRVFAGFERVPEFAQVAAASGSPASLQERAFAGYSELLARLCARGPLVVWLDDLHWADVDSLTFLEHLLTHLTAPLLLILGRRGDSAEGGQLARMLARVVDQRRVRVDTLALGPLTPSATAQVIAAIAPAARSIEAIVSGSAGNPLFAAQLARFSAASNLSELPSFEALLSSRVAQLGPGAARLLELLVFAGEPLLARAALAAADALHDDLEQLASLQLARIEGSHGAHGSGKTVACYHDRIRETLSARLSHATRRYCAERLASALSALDADSLELLCRCQLAAGNLAEARRLMWIAADRAMAALAFDHAAELYARVLTSSDLSPAEQCTLHEQQAVALESEGRASDAAAAYHRAAMLVRGPEQLALLRRAAAQLLYAGAYAEGLPLLEQVCRAHDVPMPSGLMGDAVRLLALQARLRTRGLGFPAAPPVPVDQTRLDLSSLVALTLLNYRSPVQGLCAVSRFLLTALESASYRHTLQALGLNAITQAHIAPDGVWCRRLVARLTQLAHEHEDPIALAYASFVRGAVAHEAGRFELARGELAGALAGYRTLGGSLHEAVDIALLYEQRNDYALADYTKLAAETPAAISEAYRRGRVWLGTMLMGMSGLVAFLLDNHVDAASRGLAEARSRYRPAAELQTPDVALHVSETALFVYLGEPSRALALQQTRGPALRRALSARGNRGRLSMTVWAGMLAASTLRHERPQGTRRNELRVMIRDAAIATRRSRSPGKHSAHLFDAALELELGRHDAAAASLHKLLAEAELPERHLGVVAVRHRLGQLTGGAAGRALIDQARVTMAAHGIRDPEAMMELFAPGFVGC